MTEAAPRIDAARAAQAADYGALDRFLRGRLIAQLAGLRHGRVLLPQIAAFLRTPAFVMLWAGFVIAVPLAQLVGHAPFFRLFMDEVHVRDIKRVFEESGEFMGYLILLFGTLESLLQFATVGEQRRVNNE